MRVLLCVEYSSEQLTGADENDNIRLIERLVESTLFDFSISNNSDARTVHGRLLTFSCHTWTDDHIGIDRHRSLYKPTALSLLSVCLHRI